MKFKKALILAVTFCLTISLLVSHSVSATEDLDLSSQEDFVYSEMTPEDELSDTSSSLDSMIAELPELVITSASVIKRTDYYIEYKYTIKNTGTVTIPSMYKIVIKSLYSANKIFNDAGDVSLGATIIGDSSSLAPGESHTGTYGAGIPPSKDMKFIMFKIDSTNIVAEYNEFNNTRALSLYPDLVISNAQVTKTAFGLDYSYTIKNVGGKKAPSLRYIVLDSCYSANTIYNDPGDIAAGSFFIEESVYLAPGQSYTVKGYSLYPTPSGMNYIIFKVDARDDIYESNESNNTKVVQLER